MLRDGFQGEAGTGRDRGERTSAELATKYGIHQRIITAWKRQAIEGLASMFTEKSEAAQASGDAELTRLRAHDFFGVIVIVLRVVDLRTIVLRGVVRKEV